MKYLRVFNNDAEYQQFKDGDEYITPNVCLNKETNGIKIVEYDFEDGEDNSSLITFSIESPNPEFPLLERQAESGMTWEEWVHSNYNLMYEDIYQHFETFSHNSVVIHYEESWRICYDRNNTYVGKEDIIIPNYRYTYDVL